MVKVTLMPSDSWIFDQLHSIVTKSNKVASILTLKISKVLYIDNKNGNK